MKIILDTNVILAAFATRGLCSAVFELCLDRFEIVISENILREVAENLDRKIKLPPSQCDLIVSYLRNHCTMSQVEELDGSLCRDASDIHVLGLARRSSADYIITGDKDLLELTQYNDTRIITPRQFWAIVKG